MTLEVTGNVYSLDMWSVKRIEVANLEIVRVENYEEIRDRLGRGENHIATGKLTIRVPNEIMEPRLALDYAEREVQDYWMLLSFCQGHDVPIGHFQCQGFSKSSIGRTGKTTGAGAVLSFGIQDFLSTAIPLVRDKKYVEETGVVRAIQFYNEAVNMQYAVIELQLPAFFVGLEVLANAHFSSHPKDFVLGEKEWDELFDAIGKAVDSAPRGREVKNRISSSLATARGSISDKINYLIESVGLGDYSRDVSRIVRMRNDILHGKPLREKYDGEGPSIVLLKCERLLPKLILKLLKFYDHKSVHGAFTNSDLRAED